LHREAAFVRLDAEAALAHREDGSGNRCGMRRREKSRFVVEQFAYPLAARIRVKRQYLRFVHPLR
jgi:hypothetical protein